MNLESYYPIKSGMDDLSTSQAGPEKRTIVPDAITTYIWVILWLFLCAYIVIYNNNNSLASAFSLITTSLFFGLLFVCSVYCSAFAVRLILLIGVLAGTSFILFIGGDAEGNVNALLRYCISLSALGVFIFSRVKDLRSFLSYGAAAVVIYATIVAVTSGPLSYSGAVRFAPFFGGATAVHSSSITMVALIIIIWSAPWRRSMRLLLCIAGGVLCGGYGVTTALLMLVIFFAAVFLDHYKLSLKWVGVVAVVALPIGAAWRDSTQVVGGDVASLGIGSLGSGRLAAWVERLQIFANSDFLTKMIGDGPYSDQRTTSLWWWSEKGAHSDLMTVLMEFGVVGVVCLFIYLAHIFRKISSRGRAALISIICGMILSNVLLDRPTVAMVWGFAIYSGSRITNQCDVKKVESTHVKGSKRPAKLPRYESPVGLKRVVKA